MSSRALVAVLFVSGFLFRGIPSASADDFTQQVVDLTNSERVKQGLSPLTVSDSLGASAQAYASEMATMGFFSHVAPDGSTLIQRDAAAGYTHWSYLAENIASGQRSPAEVVAAWLNSPDHRANLLSPRIREIGVGYVFRDGSPSGSYWVQEFASSSEAAPPTAASPPTTYHDTWIAPTGHTVSGSWLDFLRRHGDVDVLGLPRSDVIQDPITGQLVQYFQRAVLEWHPENPPASRIQRRLLGDALYAGADIPVLARSGSADYFPFSLNALSGLGHAASNFAPSGQAVYFKDFFDSYGGIDTFGYPKEGPTLRNGQWTQRFQAAVFENHPEFDRDGFVPGTQTPLRTYRVQLELLGDEYIHALGLSLH